MFKEKTIFFWLYFCRLDGVFAGTDAVKSVSVMEGDSVSLNSSLTEIQEDEEIFWTFGTNGPLIAKTDGVNNIIPYVLDGRFRDRLKLDKKTGSLTIMNITTNHTGVYEVEISNSRSETKHRFTVTVYGVFAGTDAVKSVSVMEGDSVSLNSDLTEIQKDEEIMWKFGTNGSLIAKTDGVKNTIYDGPDGRFKDRLKLDKKTGSLTIMNIRTEDAGVYEVEIISSRSETKHRFNVTVYAATTPDPHTSSGSPSSPLSPTSHTPSGPSSGSASGSSGPPSGPPSGTPSGSSPGPVSPTALISAAAAAGFLLIVAVVGMIFICKKHRKPDQEVETRDEEITYADPTFYKRNTQKSGVKEEDEVIYAKVVTRR